jgi:hypothetical protein
MYITYAWYFRSLLYFCVEVTGCPCTKWHFFIILHSKISSARQAQTQNPINTKLDKNKFDDNKSHKIETNTQKSNGYYIYSRKRA